MSDLLIFDPYDTLLAVLSNEVEGACPFWNAPFKEILNNGSTFEFTAPADHEDAQFLVAENQVAFMDKDGAFRLFVIREPERTNGADGPQITAICEPAMLELNDEILEDVRPYDTTASDALTRALEGCRWQVGEVAELGNNSTNYYYINVTEAITKILNTWGGELRDRVEIEDNKIVGRYIDILPRRGADTGKLWEIDKDILSITHKVRSYPKTALYGRGSSLEVTDEEGNATGGFTRKINFADVEWSVENGDPADKPLGQEWVGDPEALVLYGRDNDDGTKRHRKGIYDNGEQEDSEKLLQETWEALQEQKRPLENYEMDVFLLEEITGYEHEKVRLGDTSIALDRSFAKPIEIEARVIVFEYDVADPDNTGTVEMGQYIDLYADARLDEIEARLNDKSGLWDRGGTHPVTDDRFPDTVPPTPANFEAEGLFRSIMLSWVYDASSYIAAYEVYGSQIQGFTPDSSNLLWKGRTGGYVHNADTNQQWYFRIRTINHHGTVSPWSVEVTANTQRVISTDILFGEEIAAELRELSKTAQLLADGSISGDLEMVNGLLTVRQGAIGTAAIANAAINKLHLQEGIVGFLQIEKAVITDELISPTANIDFAKIANVEITNAMITGKLDANKVQIGPMTTFDSGYDPSKIDVGSRNLIKNTSFDSTLGWTTWSGSGRIVTQTVGNDSYKHLVVIGDDLADRTPLAFYGSNTSQWSFAIHGGLEYTASFLIRASNILNLDYCYIIHSDGGTNVKLPTVYYDNFPVISIGGYDYYKVSFTFTADRDDSQARLLIGGRSGIGYTYMYISKLKLEQGNKATDWTPAPEDVDEKITNAETSAKTYADDNYGVWKYPNSTLIDGGKIFTGSIDVNKLKAGTIDTATIKIHGGTTTEYTKIDGAFLESRGKFTRTWQGETYDHDVALQFQNGYFAARSLTDDRNLYYSNFGISTYASGNQDESSGTIEFFSYDYHDTRKGLTLSSVGGVVALRSSLERVILDSLDHTYLISRGNNIKVQPRQETVSGNNTFTFHVIDNADPALTDGVLFYGSENTPQYAAGLRFSKSTGVNTVYVTDGTHTRGTGNLEAKNVKANGVFEGYLVGPSSGDNAYAGTDYEFRVTDKNFYNNGSPVYKPVRASEYRNGSSMKYKTNIEDVEDVGLATINNLSVKKYLLQSDVDNGVYYNWQVGLISELSPEVATHDQEAINLYKLTSYNTKAIQELSVENESLKERVNGLETVVGELSTENDLLKQQLASIEERLAALEGA